ncbi:MAG: FAD-dependent oxidoreductase [Clostridiales bacterium]|jgi:glycine/D-amino acid oxidase-like deaminating enzyme|nr:FAD-dependent oxidoreductase [Clostridiales bacterium]
MLSAWSDNSRLPEFESLKQKVKTDVLIIGGGLAGILCAHMLARQSIDYILVEAETICKGVTKNTTAKITSQHGLIYDKLIKKYGAEKALMYLRANQEALAEYKKLCAEIDCDFEEKDAFVYSLDKRDKIEKEVEALKRLNFNAEFTEKTNLPFSVAGAERFKGQAQFNPLKFVSEISKNLNIFEHTNVRELTEHTAVTGEGGIEAKKIIVATHFPFINKHGAYFLKMFQHRSYVIAIENAQDISGMYVDESEKGMSFRNYENLLLIGGGGHRTGKKGGDWRELREYAAGYYPNSKEKYFWATQDCMTLDGVPYIGNYSKNTPDFYVATGFNKWGITTSMAAAKILCDMVTGKQNEFAEVFDPGRSMIAPQLLINTFEAVVNLLTVSKRRCPHLGCALKWNAAERSWDCPCHGSRFDENGGLINNPATGNMKNPD